MNIHEVKKTSTYIDPEMTHDDQYYFEEWKIAVGRQRAIGAFPQTQDPFDGPKPTRDPSLDILQERGYVFDNQKSGTVVYEI